MAGVSTTTAIWEQLQVNFEINVKGCIFFLPDYITPDWQRQALVLGCVPFAERHNSANIANWIVAELDDWKLITVTEMIVSDTASNQLGIFNRELAPDLPRHFQPSRCSCHVLQLCIGDCILAKPNIARIIKDCRYVGLIKMPYLLWIFRSICTHANISINFCNGLREVQLELDPDCTVLLLK